MVSYRLSMTPVRTTSSHCELASNSLCRGGTLQRTERQRVKACEVHQSLVAHFLFFLGNGAHGACSSRQTWAELLSCRCPIQTWKMPWAMALHGRSSDSTNFAFCVTPKIESSSGSSISQFQILPIWQRIRYLSIVLVCILYLQYSCLLVSFSLITHFCLEFVKARLVCLERKTHVWASQRFQTDKVYSCYYTLDRSNSSSTLESRFKG